MNARQLTVGRRIRVINDFTHDGLKFKVGDKGKIVRVRRYGSVGIEWKKRHFRMHTLDKLCKNHHGWNIDKDVVLKNIGIIGNKVRKFVL